jgi:hypothetical protein
MCSGALTADGALCEALPAMRRAAGAPAMIYEFCSPPRAAEQDKLAAEWKLPSLLVSYRPLA